MFTKLDCWVLLFAASIASGKEPGQASADADLLMTEVDRRREDFLFVSKPRHKRAPGDDEDED